MLPEAVWSAATGGGTWVTELQITDHTGSSSVDAYYYYTTGAYRAVSLWTSPGYENSAKWSNILATMQALDGGFTYYGTSGCLWLNTQGTGNLISAAARISNGNYGKTLPGLQWTDSNTANLNRNMRLMNIMFSSNYRTFGGFFNAISGGYSMTVRLWVIGTGWVYYGATDETFAPWEYKSFNVFTRCGITSGTYTSNWLWVNPTASGSSGANTKGLICYGSIANNTTNDTYAIIAVQWQ
jgi:hypothetical protein